VWSFSFLLEINVLLLYVVPFISLVCSKSLKICNNSQVCSGLGLRPFFINRLVGSVSKTSGSTACRLFPALVKKDSFHDMSWYSFVSGLLKMLGSCSMCDFSLSSAQNRFTSA
jgi:hypothetical protein